MNENIKVWAIPSKHGNIKVLVEAKAALVTGDQCMFYNAISEVTDVHNPEDPVEDQSVAITTQSYISEEDAEFMGKPELGDTWGIMKHSFSTYQMGKILGATHEGVGVPLIDDEGNFI